MDVYVEHIPTSFYTHTEKKIRLYTLAIEKKFVTTPIILITTFSAFTEHLHHASYIYREKNTPGIKQKESVKQVSQPLEFRDKLCNLETDYNKDCQRYIAGYMTRNMEKPLTSSQVTPTNLGNSAKYIWERNQIYS